MGTLKKRFIELHGEEAWREQLEKYKVRYQKEKEKRVAYQREYNEAHREQINKRQREYDPKYYDTKRGRAAYLLNGYRQMDKNRELGETTLTQKWIIENIFNSKCVYCGETDWKRLGCDRINNDLPHTQENVVCSCLNCNNQRSDRMSFEEFIEYKKGEPDCPPLRL